MRTSGKRKVILGLMAWISFSLFFINPFLDRKHLSSVIGAALIVLALFLALAPFARLPVEQKMQRTLSLLFMLAGVLSILATFVSSGVLEMLLKPASVTAIILGILILSDALLQSFILRRTFKGIARFVCAALCLITLAAGPILIGLPVLQLIELLK